MEDMVALESMIKELKMCEAALDEHIAVLEVRRSLHNELCEDIQERVETLRITYNRWPLRSDN